MDKCHERTIYQTSLSLQNTWSKMWFAQVQNTYHKIYLVVLSMNYRSDWCAINNTYHENCLLRNIGLQTMADYIIVSIDP